MLSECSETEFLSVRLNIQGLSDQNRSIGARPAAIVSRQTAVQAQDLAAARLGIGARSNAVTDAEVELARTPSQSIVRTWCLRGTLHLIARRDVHWILSLVGPMVVGAARPRLAQVGLDDATCARALSIIRELMAGAGPMRREEVVQRLAEGRVRLVGQAKYHVLRLAALQGLLCFGPDRGTEPTYVRLDSPTVATSRQSRHALIERLIHRYLEAHAPAQLNDFLTWSGLSATLVQQVWQQISSKFAWVTVKRETYAILQSQRHFMRDAEESVGCVRLLPRFDAYVLGYRKRDLVVPREYVRRMQPGGGVMHNFMLVDGRVAGTWALKPGQAGFRLQAKPFSRLNAPRLRALEAEHERLVGFLDTTAELDVQWPPRSE